MSARYGYCIDGAGPKTVHQRRKPNVIDTCPKCGGTAVLVQERNEIQEVPDLSSPTGKVYLPIKVEEFKCQEQSCEHEFEKIVRESTT
jgi:transposase